MKKMMLLGWMVFFCSCQVLKIDESSYGLPQEIWSKCRYQHNGQWMLDMASDTWCGLSVSEQQRYMAGYQQGYANAKDLEVEKTVQNSGTDFTFRLVPPGLFWMGSDNKEKDRERDEGPRHKVIIAKPFYLATTEITQEQWHKVTGEKPWINQINAKDDPSHPASHISWNDIKQKFLPKLGTAFAMPTEAQWEYACRGGVTRRFYWGDDNDYSKIGSYAWYYKNTWDVEEKYAHAVAQKKPNSLGIYDMIGNLSEWCEDWKGDYSSDEQIDPTGPPTGNQRVGRGARWYSFPQAYRSSFRSAYPPNILGNVVGGRLQFRIPDIPDNLMRLGNRTR